MQKETVLAKMRAGIHFSEEALHWLRDTYQTNSNAWFAAENGTLFLKEFHGTWNSVFVQSTQPTIDSYFAELGLEEQFLPKVTIYEAYAGSWIIEAAVVMFSSVGTAYTILKAASELPKIADGLTELKGRLKREFQAACSPKVQEHLEQASKRLNLPLPLPPTSLISTDFTIDARPLTGLTPSIMKSHKLHMNVAVSRDSLTIENLGGDVIRNIRIGLFKGTNERNQWSYTDSYTGSIDILSPGQTTTRPLTEFKNTHDRDLDLYENDDLYVDCWVQDTHGIYLFNFFLEK